MNVYACVHYIHCISLCICVCMYVCMYDDLCRAQALTAELKVQVYRLQSKLDDTEKKLQNAVVTARNAQSDLKSAQQTPSASFTAEASESCDAHTVDALRAELELSRSAALSSAESLAALQLQESAQRRTIETLESQLSELCSENSKLAGHRNLKQKINHYSRVKQENLQLTQVCSCRCR
jgi:hypothetical protein